VGSIPSPPTREKPSQQKEILSRKRGIFICRKSHTTPVFDRKKPQKCGKFSGRIFRVVARGPPGGFATVGLGALFCAADDTNHGSGPESGSTGLLARFPGRFRPLKGCLEMNTRSTYAAFYISSAGQPRNGLATFASKRAAIRAARAYRAALSLRGGGYAIAERNGAPSDPPEQIYCWREFIEGGFRAV